jgi:hypothetical protein
MAACPKTPPHKSVKPGFKPRFSLSWNRLTTIRQPLSPMALGSQVQKNNGIAANTISLILIDTFGGSNYVGVDLERAVDLQLTSSIFFCQAVCMGSYGP